MTTLTDLMKDLAIECAKKGQENPDLPLKFVLLPEELEPIIEEYTELIKEGLERWVG